MKLVVAFTLVCISLLNAENISAQDESLRQVPSVGLVLDNELGRMIGQTGPEFPIAGRRTAISSMFTLFSPEIETDLEIYSGVIHAQFNWMSELPEISNDESRSPWDWVC